MLYFKDLKLECKFITLLVSGVEIKNSELLFTYDTMYFEFGNKPAGWFVKYMRSEV